MLYLPHVMWQPFFRCEQGCSSCYLKGSRFVEDQRLFPHLQLMSTVCGGKEVSIGELVVSVDKVKKFHPSEKALLLQLLQLNVVGPVREIQLAVYDINTVLQILEFSPYLQIEQFKHISISHLRNRNINILFSWRAKNPELRINWNLLANKENLYTFSPEYNQFNGHLDSSQLEWIGTHVDTIHLIREKKPLGQKQSVNQGMRFSWMLDWLYQAELQSKVRLDLCEAKAMKEYNFPTDNLLCKDQIHIWPDGSVTCCPYDSNGAVHDQPGGIIENIKNALRSESPFVSRCQLR